MLRRLFGGGRNEGQPAISEALASAESLDTMLRRLTDSADSFAILHLDDERNWYLQAAWGKGVLVTEAVSNAYLKAANRLGATDETRLTDLGWTRASEGDNWTRLWPGWPQDDPTGPRDLLLATLPIYGRREGEQISIETGA